MRVPLSREWAEKFSALPETGMGYQRVRIRLRDGRALSNIVLLNSQILQVPAGVPAFTTLDIVAIDLESTERRSEG